jgi:ABC-type polysaccharide/polyol phosphate export permease
MEAIQAAFRDLIDGVRLAPLWLTLGWEQTAARFRRTVLGPFWLTANLLAMAFAISFIVGGLFGNGDWRKTFALTISGILCWSIVGGYLADASNVFISAGDMMNTMRMPLTFHVLLMMYKNFINFLAQLIALWIVLFFLKLGALPSVSLLIGLPIVLIDGCLLSMIIAMPATRFRDVQQTIAVSVQILFFLTPVFWAPAQMQGKRSIILTLNPFAHLLELIRQPLLGSTPSFVHWEWGIGLMFVLGAIAVTMLTFYRKRIVFWL